MSRKTLAKPLMEQSTGKFSGISALSLGMTLCLAAASLKAADWPQWRGPNRDGKSADTGLLKEWPAAGPKLAWKTSGLGLGYSSVALKGDRLYTMGDLQDASYLMAFPAAGGPAVWTTKVGRGGRYG